MDSSSSPSPTPSSQTHRALSPNVFVHPNRSVLGRGEYMDDHSISTPIAFAHALAASGALALNHKTFGEYLDLSDPFWKFGNYFAVPSRKSVWPPEFRKRMDAIGDKGSAKDQGISIYLAGNSLGLMPLDLKGQLADELHAWGTLGVLGHTEHPAHDWVSIDSIVTPSLARFVGANSEEVACMGSLTANLHALFTSFYKPTPRRHKIMYEAKAFPSDEYAFASQIALHDYPPSSRLSIAPLPGEYTLRTSEILKMIEEHGDTIAVICIGAVQYYTGQFFDLETITKAGHAKGCLVAFDLAHAIGNVPLQLHDWGVDFAAWCSYKYLNAGPGAIAGIFVHSRHENHKRLQGWWGHDSATRFSMPPTFSPLPGAAGWQFSNPSVLDVVALHTSLKIFQRADQVATLKYRGQVTKKFPFLAALREKSATLTDYLEILLRGSKFFVEVERMPAGQDKVIGVEGKKEGLVHFTIITPRSNKERGAQLSLLFHPHEAMPAIMDRLREQGVLGDERQPGVIRFAPIPLYNTYSQVLEASDALERALSDYPRWKEAKDGREKLLEEKRRRKKEKGKNPPGEESDDDEEEDIFAGLDGTSKESGKGSAFYDLSGLPDKYQKEITDYKLQGDQQLQLDQLETLSMGDPFESFTLSGRGCPGEDEDGESVDQLINRMQQEVGDRDALWRAKAEQEAGERGQLTERIAKLRRRQLLERGGPVINERWDLPLTKAEQLKRELKKVQKESTEVAAQAESTEAEKETEETASVKASGSKSV